MPIKIEAPIARTIEASCQINPSKGINDMNIVAKTDDVSNSVKTMPAIMYNNVPVVTTEKLAELYETKSNNIKVNHSRNTSRFIEGKHYFKVIGNALKNLRVTLSNLQISPKARSLILWTERGAARHAKMLDTDKAWDVFELMEDYYFNHKKTEVMEKAKPEKQYRYLIDIKIHDTELKDTHEFLGKATTPENIIHGLARRYGYAIERMLSLPPNCI